MKHTKRAVCLCLAALLFIACSFAGCGAGGWNAAMPPAGPQEPGGEDFYWLDDGEDPYWPDDGESPDWPDAFAPDGQEPLPTEAPATQDLAQLDPSAYSGAFGSRTTLTDPTTGVPVMDAVLPQGWTAQVQTNWSFVSTVNPCVAVVQFTSPDGRAAVVIQTAQDFLESYDTSGLFPHQDYIDQQTYIVHLAYKNAGEMLDMYFNGVLGTGGTVVSETPVPAEAQQLVDQVAQNYLTTLVNGVNEITSGYVSPVQAGGSEGTISLRRYRFTAADGQSYLADAMALTVAAQYTHSSTGTSFVNIHWVVPGIVICIAQDEATLEEYSTQFEMITENAVIRNEFNYIKSLYGNDIRNKIMQQQASSIAAMTEAQAQTYLNSYDSSNSSGYTSDDWANDWSDFIYDRNEYTTADGSNIKVGTDVDAVYQNGDDFYFGSQGSAPFGWEQLTPN